MIIKNRVRLKNQIISRQINRRKRKKQEKLLGKNKKNKKKGL